jgi:hypothetical protein
MQILLDRIQQLEKRVSELEDHERKQSAAQTGTSDSQTVAESTPVQANAAPARALHSEHPASTTEIRETQVHYPSLQIRGFGDIDFSATDQKGSVSGFDLGQFVLHLASPLSEKVSYFGEVSFTAQPSGYDLQVERTIIRYDYNDYFKMSFGKDRLLEYCFPPWGLAADDDQPTGNGQVWRNLYSYPFRWFIGGRQPSLGRPWPWLQRGTGQWPVFDSQ